MKRYWDIGSLAICVVCMLFFPPIGVPLLILYIVGCVWQDNDIKVEQKRIKDEETAKRERIKREAIEYEKEINEMRAGWTPEHRRQQIEAYLTSCHSPEAIKWQRDAFPEDVDFVLDKMGLIYDEEKEEVYETYSGRTLVKTT